MPKDETYFFHQTPPELAKELIKTLPLVEGDVLLEAFKGEGSFFNNFPTNTHNVYCEIEEGLCYTSFKTAVDWVITNPPFRLETGVVGKRENAFYKLVEYFAPRVRKGIAFLANDYCFSTLTPKRMKFLNETYGLYVNGYVVCNVKKWRGRYFFITFTKIPNANIKYLEGSF
jgi:hypothetical protein